MKTKLTNRTALVAAAAWAVIGATPVATLAQNVQTSEAIASSDVLSQIPMFSYKEGPKSQLLFRGTPIAAMAEGQAQVEFENGNAQIAAKVEDLPKPGTLGAYTTYVLWALTPDGRSDNKGVLADFEGGKGEIDTQHGASQFALIVTAEPHFAVTVPSTMIVLYNIDDDVKGGESKVTTLTERADYSRMSAIAIDDEKNPAEVVQARYALAIARDAGAERFATAAFAAATEKLGAAERALSDRKTAKTAPGLAREAVVAGEDARRASMLASAAAKVETERVAAAAASDEAARQAAAVSTQAAAQAAAVSTEAAAQAATASSNAAVAAAQVAAANTVAATETERQRSEVAAASAARNDLRNRLNAALPTRDSNRGLISEIGGVQFATGAAILNESARENLAKFSGIVASYPTMRFNVEGHTDSTGSVATNNALSLQRAMAVRDYLIGRGVSAASIDVAGMGSSTPIGDNATVDSRARNRRVEIVLSGGPLTASL